MVTGWRLALRVTINARAAARPGLRQDSVREFKRRHGNELSDDAKHASNMAARFCAQFSDVIAPHVPRLEKRGTGK